MAKKPEDVAREKIDEILTRSGGYVCDLGEVNVHAHQGLAIREFPLKNGHGFADYLLYFDSKAAGVVEAKKAGSTLTGVEIQSDTFQNPWERACKELRLGSPWPRIHDLRHTWRTNARRSWIDGQISEMIMGHATKGLSVGDPYGFISDEAVVGAIDKFTNDNGSTVILTAACK
jgi:integrase